MALPPELEIYRLRVLHELQLAARAAAHKATLAAQDKCLK